MQRTRLIPHRFLPLSILIAAHFACSSASPPPPTNTAKTPTPTASSAPSAAIVAPKTLCQQLAKEQKEALDAWPVVNESDDMGALSQLKDIHETFATCTQHANGVSGPVISPPPAKSTSGDGFSWRIVYLHKDGSRSEQQDGVFLGYCYAIHLGFDRAMTINNGGELLAIQMNVSCPDGEGYDENHLYRIRGGKLETLPELAKTKFSLEDIDDDKLLDAMRTDMLKVEYPVCESMNGTFDYVFPLAMHTLSDGTLSMVDAAAKENAKKRCPQKPPAIIPKDRSSQQALDNLVCARLYGATADALHSEVDAFCKGIDTTCKCKEKGCCEDEIACRDALCGTTNAARELIAKPIPFTLK